MLCTWWHSIFRGFDFGLRANPARSLAPWPSAECKGDPRTLSSFSDKSNILLDQIVMIAVCIYCLYSETSWHFCKWLWNYRLLRNSHLWKEFPSNSFSVSAEQAIFWLQLQLAGHAFALLKGFRALHSIMWPKTCKNCTCSNVCLAVWL